MAQPSRGLIGAAGWVALVLLSMAHAQQATVCVRSVGSDICDVVSNNIAQSGYSIMKREGPNQLRIVPISTSSIQFVLTADIQDRLSFAPQVSTSGEEPIVRAAVSFAPFQPMAQDGMSGNLTVGLKCMRQGSTVVSIAIEDMADESTALVAEFSILKECGLPVNAQLQQRQEQQSRSSVQAKGGDAPENSNPLSVQDGRHPSVEFDRPLSNPTNYPNWYGYEEDDGPFTPQFEWSNGYDISHDYYSYPTAQEDALAGTASFFLQATMAMQSSLEIGTTSGSNDVFHNGEAQPSFRPCDLGPEVGIPCPQQRVYTDEFATFYITSKESHVLGLPVVIADDTQAVLATLPNSDLVASKKVMDMAVVHLYVRMECLKEGGQSEVFIDIPYEKPHRHASFSIVKVCEKSHASASSPPPFLPSTIAAWTGVALCLCLCCYAILIISRGKTGDRKSQSERNPLLVRCDNSSDIEPRSKQAS